MRLSIIMSTYNNEHTISQAIESILNQTFGDFEFIIVNDGSTDNTLDIIKYYQTKDNRIALINQENRGLTRSLNIAISLARGEYIARQDADDISLLERLQQQVNFLDEHKEIGFVGCSCEIIDERGKFLNFVSLDRSPEKNIVNLKKHNIYCHGSMMFRGKFLAESAGYREFFKYAQDYDLYLRLIQVTLPGSLNKFLYHKRVALENISIQKVRLQAAYADLAKKCYENRLLKRDDSLLLNDTYLKEASSSEFDFILPFMKSLCYLKRNKDKAARAIIHPYLFPISVFKYRLYMLWFFSYIPYFLRNAFFTVKKNSIRLLMSTKL